MKISEGLVVKLKLALERSVRDSTALTEECQDLIKHGIEVHSRSSCVNPLAATSHPEPSVGGL